MGPDDKDVRIAYLEQELGRAYRALHGYAHGVNDAMRAYHAPTLAAAKRFIFDDALDGTAYFDGKPVEMLHAALALPRRNEPEPPIARTRPNRF
jgi:hypothetical protein